MRAPRSVLLLVPSAAIVALALTGCVPQAEPGTDPTTAPTPTLSTSPSPTAAPTPGATLPPSGDPVTFGCDELLSPQAIYDFNPNFGLQDDYTPAPGSVGAQAVEQRGIACSWLNQTSGETIEVTAAKPAAESIAALQADLAASGTAVSAFGVDGYFEVSNGTGVAQVFSGPYWITASSTTFLEAGDVLQLVEAALSTLG
jgi:hypothetical protein